MTLCVTVCLLLSMTVLQRGEELTGDALRVQAFGGTIIDGKWPSLVNVSVQVPVAQFHGNIDTIG